MRAKSKFGVVVDDGQLLWRRTMRRELGGKFQELYAEDEETCFLESGEHFFDNQKIKRLLDEADSYNRTNPPAEETSAHVAWESPESGCVYAAGADVAEGVGGDYSVLAIFNVTRRRMAFRYRARVGVDTFYRKCAEFWRKYNNALLAVERNNHGHAVILGLQEITRYPDLYEEDRDTRLVIRPLQKPRERKFGWDTTSLTKSLMLDHLKIALEGDSTEDEHTFHPEFTVHDTLLLEEGLTFQSEDGKLSAAPGKYDDCVMAWAIACQLYLSQRRRSPGTKMTDILVGGKLESA